MIRLLSIEWQKHKSNTAFWVLGVLYLAVLGLVFTSGKLLLDFLAGKGEMINNIVNPANVPIYQFPDVWHNFTYVAGFLKVIPAIYIIIAITNEINFDTLRQNIMNGMSRWDFIIGKIWLICILGLASMFFVFITGLIFGLTQTQNITFKNVMMYSEFLPGYFLEIIAYLIFALFLGLLIKRAGLGIGLLLIYTMLIEPIIVWRVKVDWVKEIFPVKAINNIIHFPFPKYVLQEVQDYLAFRDVFIVLIYVILFVYLIYLLLAKRDL